MNSSQVQCILMAAKFLNFTRAAQALYITQPVLSRHIATCEKELGIAIFYRSKKKIRLTPAGKKLVSGLEDMTTNLEKVLQSAKNIQDGNIGTLSIGVPEGQVLGDIYSRVLRNIKEKNPWLHIDIKLFSMQGLRMALDEDKIDIAFTVLWEVKNQKDISHYFVKNTPHYLIISKYHPLYDEPDLTLQKLNDEIFWILADSESDAVAEMTRKLNEQLGGKLKLWELSNTGAQNLWMETGIGVAVLNDNHILCQFEDMRKIPVSEVPAAPEVIAWKTENTNPAINKLISEVKSLKEQLGLNEVLI